MRWHTRSRYYLNKNKLQTKLLKGSTTDTPDGTKVEGMRTVMSRLATINNVLPFPLTVHTPKDVMELLHTKLLQSPLEDFLRLPHPELLLHLLKEVGGTEP
jgi:hypothetical protein